MDENPITGQPGNFHLSSTGRVADSATKLLQQQGPGGKLLPSFSTYSAAEGGVGGLSSLLGKKDGGGGGKESSATEKAAKASSRTGAGTGAAGTGPVGVQKLKRRKSKVVPGGAASSSAAAGA